MLGPLGFISYTEDIVDVIECHSVLAHIYADDTQLLASAKPEDSLRLPQQLSDCVADVTQWCSSRRLQLNADKTEAIWIGSRAAINKLSSQDRSLTVGTGTTSDVVHDLGVLFDSELTTGPKKVWNSSRPPLSLSSLLTFPSRPFPSSPFPSTTLLSPPFPLEVVPPDPARGSGGAL